MIPIQHGLLLSTLLYFLGLFLVLTRRNFLFILIGLEIINNACSLILVITGNYVHQLDGQILYLLTITLSAIEAGIGLALLIQMHRCYKTLNIDVLSETCE
ncbi:NADH-quinone oxidoreductase subunit K [Buchnera aphidicola (Tetraneura ulmi)]|uniref:NADH-quinone oxidoreductase subunit NuoK n=1 Tax=Buchnera aphidicola TaxID=9 RepID=UPI0034646DD5